MAATAALGVGLAVLVERTDLPGAAPVARPARRTARGAGVRQRLRLGRRWTAASTASRGACHGRDAVLLPAGLPARRRDAARARPGARGGGLVARPLPLADVRPGRAAAAATGAARRPLLVGLHLLSEFGALALLRFPTFTTAIYDQYGSTFNGAAATAMAGVLVLLCLVLLLAELRLRGTRRYARVGRGAARGRAARLGTVALAARWRSVAALVVLALGVPTYALVHWLARRHVDRVPRSTSCCGPPARPSCSPPSARWSPRSPRSRWRGWPCATAAGSPRSSSAAPTSPTRCPASSSAWPFVVAAAARAGVYQTAVLLVVAYAILFLPRAVVTVRAGARAGAGGARRRRAEPRHRPDRDRAPGDPAAHRAEPRRRRRAGLPRDLHRADRDADARPDRHPHAGHRVLVGVLGARATAPPRPTRCCWCWSRCPRRCC